ncbi:MAG: DEAD/DEAH box helicase [Syntrophorhabdaceae bacterium]|nr:DEAD/DEAH box helicase [Syntrophorhabdaceae bacterium]
MKDIKWMEGVDTLVVSIEDGLKGQERVKVFLRDDALDFSCRCMLDNGSKGACKHVLCALFTLIHILRPNIFKTNHENIDYIGELKSALFNEKKEKGGENGFLTEKRNGRGRSKRKTPGYCILLEEGRIGLRGHVLKDGEVIEHGEGNVYLPDNLRYLLHFIEREDISFPLFIYLSGRGNRYPVFFKREGEVCEIEWLGHDAEYDTWTELNAVEEEIFLKRVCTIGNNREPAKIIGNFAFNFKDGTMVYLDKKEGWALWDALSSAYHFDSTPSENTGKSYDHTIVIPKERFNRIIYYMDEDGKEDRFGRVLFKINGRETQVKTLSNLEYTISIKRGSNQENEFVVECGCWVKDKTILCYRKILKFIRTLEFGRIPAFFKTKKRKPILYDVFFQAVFLSDRKSIDELLKKRINEETFGKRKFVTMARRFIREGVHYLSRKGKELSFVDGEWIFVVHDSKKAIKAFAILFEIFGSEVFEKIILKEHQLSVDRDKLLSNLYLLKKIAEEHGIDVCYEGLTIEESSWDVGLDVTSRSIDWFEIKPEIRYKGEPIEREVWMQALASKGVIYRKGKILVLDENSLKKLSIIAGMAEKGHTTHRELVSIPRHKIIEIFLLRKEGISVKLTPEYEEIIGRLTKFYKIDIKPIPSEIKTELRQYQKEGYYWLSFLYEHRFGACLADDMGLGKTIQTLTLLEAIKEGKLDRYGDGPFLIVVPPSLIFNWEQEILRFCPSLKVYIYRGKDRLIDMKNCDVIITSYGLIRKDISKLKEMDFHIIIFDEAQMVKNIYADTTGAVRKLKGHFKVALTGTPIENHPGEYFSIMDLVLPGLLGRYEEFQSNVKRDLQTFLPSIIERTKPFILRRTKDKILMELPPKIEYNVYLDLTEKQKKFYNKTVEEVRSTIEDAYRNNVASRAKIIALTAITKLRQICLTPQLLVPSMNETCPKIQFLMEKLYELSSENHSSLVFSQFTSFLDIVEDKIKGEGLNIYRLDGSTPVAKRKEIVESFQNSRVPSVFLLSLKAGGQGLNLTRASYVFHLDPWWNPAVEGQASDRSHRIGQKQKVIVTRLIMRHTVEEKMMLLKERKLQLYKALMGVSERGGGTTITKEDFNFLIGN